MTTWGDDDRRGDHRTDVPGWCWWGMVVVMAGVVGEAPLQVVGYSVAALVVLYGSLALAVVLTLTLRRRAARLPRPGRLLYVLAALVGGVAVVLLTKHGAVGTAVVVYVFTVALVTAAVVSMRRASARPGSPATGEPR